MPPRVQLYHRAGEGRNETARVLVGARLDKGITHLLQVIVECISSKR